MLVSHTYRFIYIKTRKTASTSVEVALERFCLPPEQEYAPPSHSQHSTPALESEYGIVGARGVNADSHKWRNHLPASEIRRNLPAEVWAGYFKFCCVRNPWDMVVSLFHFRYKEARSEPPNVIRTRFKEWLLACDRLGSDFFIYTIDGKPVVDRFIRYEKLAADFAAVCHELRLPMPVLGTYKGGLRPVGMPYTAYYDDKSRDHVARLFANDIALFGYMFGDSVLAGHCAKSGPDPMPASSSSH